MKVRMKNEAINLECIYEKISNGNRYQHEYIH